MHSLSSSTRPTLLAPSPQPRTWPFPVFPPKKAANQWTKPHGLVFVIAVEKLLLSYFPIYFKTLREGFEPAEGGKAFQQQLRDSCPNWLVIFCSGSIAFCSVLFLIMLWWSRNGFKEYKQGTKESRPGNSGSSSFCWPSFWEKHFNPLSAYFMPPAKQD